MNREEMISRILDRTEPWDRLVVGGGVTVPVLRLMPLRAVMIGCY